MKFAAAVKSLRARVRSFNTEPISREEYARCYASWGGSFAVHPDVLQFFEDTCGVKTEYRGYLSDGERTGAIGTWGPYLAGDWSALRAFGLDDRVDFGFPILYLPIAPQRRCAIVHRGAYLLDSQRAQLAGTVFREREAMSILRPIPEGLPTGKQRFLDEERRFADSGGTALDIAGLGANEIVAIYDELHVMRWNRRPLAIGELKATLEHLKRFLFGKVLWLKARPVAIQIAYRAETAGLVCIDAVNGASDRSIKNFTAGSLLLYMNGRDAWAAARRDGKRLLYSYGRSRPGYKQYWCNPVARGFAGFWLP